MIPFKLHIKTVDMNGYQGREHHPSPKDQGLLVTPLSLEVWHWSEDGTADDLVLEVRHATPVLLVSAETVKDEEHLTYVWTAITPDGRLLELIDHEVQVATRDYCQYIESKHLMIGDPRD